MVPAPEDGRREAPRHMDRRPAGTPAGPCDGAGDMGRAGREYGRSGHTDGRVRHRIAGMGRAWMDGMGGDPPVILPAGAGRVRPPTAAVRDTTTMNHSRLRVTGGLPETGGGGPGSVGVLSHAGPAVTPEGRPFGPDTRLVSVSYREGDLRDLLSEADLHGDALPVRAGRPAKRRVPGPDGGAECLRDRVAAPPALAVPATGAFPEGDIDLLRTVPEPRATGTW